MRKLNAIFMGTPDFAVPSLELLANHELINLTHVVSMPDRKSGRGYELKSPEVIEFAKSKKIKFIQTENVNKENEFISSIESSTDIIIVLAFAQFLGKTILEIPKSGCFNIHTSLLPKYRGAAPIQYTLLNGDSSGGVSIQKMVKKMDAGDLVISHEINIPNSQTGGHLYTRLKFQAALSLSELIYKISDDSISFSKQDEDLTSFAPTLKKEDGFLKFKESTFQEINNRIRALDPWPGTFCYLNEKRMKIFTITKYDNLKLNPGETKIHMGQLLIGCKDCSLHLHDIQLEGKKRGTDQSLLNGFKQEVIINPKG